MGTQAERRAARAVVASYHEAQLAELHEHVASGIDPYRVDDIDVFDVDELIHRFKRAARELWKFCWGRGAHVESVDRLLEEQAAAGELVDCWAEAGTRR